MRNWSRWFTNYPSRKLEWLISLYTVWFGIMLALPPSSMNGVTFRIALSIMPEPIWGGVYGLVGSLHCYALHIDGRAAWTPFARAAALFMNANVFLAMAFSLTHPNPWATGVLTYGFIAIGFCGAALYSAAQDCGRELKIGRPKWRRTGN